MKALRKLLDELNSLFVQKEDEIRAVLASLISGEPAILVGEAGTAKTAVVECLAKLIDARYFYYLLTRFTEPDEILGPLDINALREGRYVRRTEGRLPEAEIVFLDEIFKASSAIRNILLDIILNRRFFSGEKYERLPVLAMYTASNEISYDVEDAAFYDRLTIRKFVDGVSDDAIPKLLRCGIELEKRDLKPVLGVEDVRALQKECERRFYNASRDSRLLKKFQLFVVELRKVGITMSDRRKVKTIKVASALSILDKVSNVGAGGRAEEITEKELYEALKLTAVREKDDVRRIEEAIDLEEEIDVFEHDVVLNSYIRELRTMEAEIRNSMNERHISAICRRVRERVEKMPDTPKLRPYVERVKALVEEAESRIG